MSLTSTLTSLTTPLPLSLPVLPTAVTSVVDELEAALPATLPALSLPVALPSLPAAPSLPSLPVDLPVDLPLSLNTLPAPDALIAQLEAAVIDLSAQLESLLGALPADLPVDLPGLGDLNALIDEIQAIVDATVVPLVAGGVDLLQDVVDGVQALLANPSLNALAAGASDLLHAATAATGGALVLLDLEAFDPLLDLAAGEIDFVADTLGAALAPVLVEAPQLAPVAASVDRLLGVASASVAGLNEAAAPLVVGGLVLANDAVALVDAALIAVDPLLNTLDGLAAGGLPALPALPAAPSLDDVLGLLPTGAGLPALPALDLSGLPALPNLDLSGLPALAGVDASALVALVDTAVGAANDLLGGLPALPDLPAPLAGVVAELDAALDPLLSLNSTSVGVSLDAVATADIALQLPLI